MLLRVLTRSAWSPLKSLSDAEADHRHDRHPLHEYELYHDSDMNWNSPWDVTCDAHTGHDRH